VNIIRDINEAEKYTHETDFVRNYARNHFDLPVILKQYDEMFAKL
jgi:hypothetical protein